MPGEGPRWSRRQDYEANPLAGVLLGSPGLPGTIQTMTKKNRFIVLGHLSGDGKGNVRDETGKVLTEEEVIARLSAWDKPDPETEEGMRKSVPSEAGILPNMTEDPWEEMFTPDEESKPDIDHLSEQELIDEALRVQKEVREEKRFKTTLRLSGDGKGNIKDETGKSITEEEAGKAIGDALTLGFMPTGPLLAERFSEEQLKLFLNHPFEIVRTAAKHALYLKEQQK